VEPTWLAFFFVCNRGTYVYQLLQCLGMCQQWAIRATSHEYDAPHNMKLHRSKMKRIVLFKLVGGAAAYEAQRMC
jgi:hypothetical protein